MQSLFSEILLLIGLKSLSHSEIIWMLFGLFGQMVFFSRWIIQWIASEKESKSTIPMPFWWCSLIGGMITFVYAIHIKSFPFMLAQFVGIIIYSRNLYLIHKG